MLDAFKKWIYEQQSWLVKHDLAVLMTHADTEWQGGLAWVSGVCHVDTTNGFDYGTVVWTDDGGWNSIMVAPHEIGHT